jgi:hypothetical protein
MISLSVIPGSFDTSAIVAAANAAAAQAIAAGEGPTAAMSQSVTSKSVSAGTFRGGNAAIMGAGKSRIKIAKAKASKPFAGPGAKDPGKSDHWSGSIKP